MGKIITISSTKGGTGKTFYALLLAGIYAKKKLKTIIVDIDLSSGIIALSLKTNTDKDIYILSEDLKNNQFENLDDYVIKYNKYLSVLASPTDPRKYTKFSYEYLEIILEKLKKEYDIVLVDTNHIIDEVKVASFDKSDQVLFVLSNNLGDIKNLKSLIAIFKDLSLNNYKILLNKSLELGKSNISEYDIKNALDTNINYTFKKEIFIKDYHKYMMAGKIPTLDKNFLINYKKEVIKLENLANDLILEESGDNHEK